MGTLRQCLFYFGLGSVAARFAVQILRVGGAIRNTDIDRLRNQPI
jgi:hypothetical protein